MQQRRGDIAEEILIEQRDQPPDLGAAGRRAVDHRVLVDRLFEILADRAAIDQGQPLLGIVQHRGAPSRIHREKFVAPFPRVLAPQLIADALLAQQQANLAAERAERELIELPHGLPPCPNQRAASTRGRANAGGDFVEQWFARSSLFQFH